MLWIIGVLLNTSTSRWHPILFRSSPLPSDPEGEFPRYRSHGHHTAGFDFEADARTEAVRIAERLCVEGIAEYRPEVSMEWDGQSIPAITSFFKHPVRN